MFPHSLDWVACQARRGLVRSAGGAAAMGVAFTLGACTGDSARTEARAGGAESASGSAPSGAASSRISTDTMAAPRGLMARGDSIFHGLAAGGTCQTCHGVDAKGGALAPDLTDATWLHGDGSTAFVVRIVTSGVAAPKQSRAPMPPLGGASLSPADVQAVAAYVSALSGARPRP